MYINVIWRGDCHFNVVTEGGFEDACYLYGRHH